MIYIKKATIGQYLKFCSFRWYLGYTFENNIYIYQLKWPLINKYFNVDRLIRHEKLHLATNLGILKISHQLLDQVTSHGLLPLEDELKIIDVLEKLYPFHVQIQYVTVDYKEIIK